MQPITQNNKSLNRGPSSSEEYNELRNDIVYDITRLFNASNQNESDIIENMTILIRENYFLQNKIAELEASLDDIKSKVDQRLGITRFNKLHKRFTDMNDIVSTNQALIDTVYRLATIRTSNAPISKTSLVDSDGLVYIPKQLDIAVSESFDSEFSTYTTVDREADPELDKVVDKNIATYWTKETVGATDDTALYINVHIKLPLNVISNALVNTIKINPYPEYGLSITDITYKSFGGTWRRMSTYPLNADGTPQEISNIARSKFTFPDTEITEIQIKMKQPYWLLESGKKIFTYGFQEIGIEYSQVDAASAEFVTKLSISDTGGKFVSINKPVAIPATGCPSAITDLVSFELYYDTDLTEDFQFGYEIMADIDTVYVKTIIAQKGGVVPVLDGIEVEYLAR
jgi:hypothetical protein